MHQYQFQHGDKPLAGYTIERAAGRGGFGEVYYAISDSGRQVALKTVQNYEQIELRGIKQCMNLKNPHLVTIFDVKYNDQGRPFVIMEFVSGMNLRDLLDEHPQGIGPQKAAFFLREIAKGLSYLHECGIVHRDIKPGNIFYENGIVKIGDYGLTKAINHTQHSAQTITVGTVHYMAPEIGEGKYDFSIDIYALGILLYEMLTGQVPFFGSSPGEILMKHMAHEPDLTGIDPTFAKVIKKALAKDPAQRYQSVREMVEAVFGTEHIRNSVSQFAPESLSIIADRMAQKAGTASPPPPPPPSPPLIDPPVLPGSSSMGEMGEKIGRRLGEAAEQFGRKVSQAAVQLDQHRQAPNTSVDPLNRRQRRLLAIMTVFGISVAGGFLVTGGSQKALPPTAMALGLCIFGATLGILLGRFRLLNTMEPGGTRKFLTGILGIVGAALVSGKSGLNAHGMDASFLIFALAILFSDWWKLTASDRRERIEWGPVIGGAVFGFFLAIVFYGNGVMAATMIAGTLLAVQVASPFGVPGTSDTQDDPEGRRASMGDHVSQRFRNFKKRVSQRHQKSGLPQSDAPQPLRRPVPRGLRALFFMGSILLLGFGLFCLILAGVGNPGGDFTPAVAFGVNALLLSLFFLIRGSYSTMKGWFSYLIKPSLMHLCLMTIVFSSIVMGCENLQGDNFAIALFFIIFPAFLFFVLLFIPSSLFKSPKPDRNATAEPPHLIGGASPRTRFVALLLAIPIWFPAGIHRFYVGKIVSGLFWLLTGGLFGMGQFIDILLILTGNFYDAEGRRLVYWTRPAAIPRLHPIGESEPVGHTPFHGTESPDPKPTPGDGPEVPPPASRPIEPDSSGSVHRSSAFLTAYERLNPVGTLLALMGYLLILAAVVVALLTGSHLSSLVAAGLPDPQINKDLTKFFGDATWPQTVDQVGMIVAGLILFISLILVTVGRRKAGGAHIIRAVLGMGLLFVAMCSIPHWLPQQADPGVVALFNTGKVGPAVTALLVKIASSSVQRAAVFTIAAIFLLVWPAKRRNISYQPLQPVQGVN